MTYLDHAATTPLVPAAVAALTEQVAQVGNASSLHAHGRRARRVVEESREELANVWRARPSEVVFTSGGTESDNLAVKGLFWAARAADPRRNRIISTAVEHHAVLDPVKWLGAHEGAVVELLGVDATGRVDPDELRATLGRADDVALVSVMWANSEVGTIQPVAECAAIAAEFAVPFHTDAVQAAAWLDLDVDRNAAFAMTISAHKLGGPLGIGALLLSRALTPVPLLHGGGQERDVRSGTLDVPAIAAFAAAVSENASMRDTRARRVADLRDQLVRGIEQVVPDAQLNGPPLSDRTHRLPGHAHLSFPGCAGDSLLLLLDARGISVSTGSACSAGIAQPSHVLVAMGADPSQARSSLRFSLGHTTTQSEIDDVIAAIGPVVARARTAGAA